MRQVSSNAEEGANKGGRSAAAETRGSRDDSTTVCCVLCAMQDSAAQVECAAAGSRPHQKGFAAESRCSTRGRTLSLLSHAQGLLDGPASVSQAAHSQNWLQSEQHEGAAGGEGEGGCGAGVGQLGRALVWKRM